MSNISQITIGGNLTRNPEQSATPSGRSMVKFSVACSRWNKRKKEKYTAYYNVTIWNESDQAFFMSRAQKGTAVVVSGTYDPVPSDDGTKVYHDISYPTVELGVRQRTSGPVAGAPSRSTTQVDDGYGPIDNDDDIPF